MTTEETATTEPKITVRKADRVAPAQPKAEEKKLTIDIVDALGRTLTVKKTNPLTRYRVAKLLGPDNSTNLGLLGLAWACASVSAIDGEPAYFLTELQLENMLQRLDDAGIEAVNQVYIDEGWNQAEDVDKAAAKN